jgi:hypothetical protein
MRKDSPIGNSDSADTSQTGFSASEPIENEGTKEPKTDLVAHLHPPIRRTRVRYTGRYSVTFDGETVVKGSRDPETDLARALLAKGITGMAMVMDANTKKHRSTVNIEKAAKLRTEEGPYGPRLVRFRETVVERPHAAKMTLCCPPCLETATRP